MISDKDMEKVKSFELKLVMELNYWGRTLKRRRLTSTEMKKCDKLGQNSEINC
jgi:hypothetical protein